MSALGDKNNSRNGHIIETTRQLCNAQEIGVGVQPLEFNEIHDVIRHGRELVLIKKQLGAPLEHKTLVR